MIDTGEGKRKEKEDEERMEEGMEMGGEGKRRTKISSRDSLEPRSLNSQSSAHFYPMVPSFAR